MPYLYILLTIVLIFHPAVVELPVNAKLLPDIIPVNNNPVVVPISVVDVSV
jgi:hypothetical protein